MFDSLLGAANGTTEGNAEGPSHSESVGDEYLYLRAEIDRLEAQAASLLHRVDEQRPWRADGYSSTTAWLTHRARMRKGRAARLVMEARALADMPATTERYRAGALSHDETAELIRARSLDRDEFPAHEEALADAARGVAFVSDLRRVCDYWHQAVSEPPSGDRDSLRNQRYLSVSQTFDGMVKIDGLLDPEVGSAVLEKIEAATPPPDGERTARQRRADAFADAVLGASTTPGHTVLVHLDHDQKMPRFETAETIRGAVLGSDTAERLTCDARIERIVHGPDGRILDHGRSQRTVSGPMKRALVARDRHCRFPGCQRPPWWTEAAQFRKAKLHCTLRSQSAPSHPTLEAWWPDGHGQSHPVVPAPSHADSRTRVLGRGPRPRPNLPEAGPHDPGVAPTTAAVATARGAGRFTDFPRSPSSR